MKVLVLVSGGLDSTTLLAKAVNEYGSENVIALNIFYGQKHEREIICAKKQANKYVVPFYSANLSEVFKYSTSNPLIKVSTFEVPEKSYAEQLAELGGSGTVSTYIPFRNGLFLSYASAIALQVGAEQIWYGAHADDAAGRAYPDCTPDFIDAMTSAIWLGSGGKIDLVAPFIEVNKAWIVSLGISLDVDFALTWSCYNGGEMPCGKCGTCIDREAAFKANGMIDPLYPQEESL